MLISLSITNYALIENLEIDFLDGFSVITGETGAGKSIIIGALSLILGNRADLGVLRDKGKKCIIEGVFRNDKLKLNDFFEKNDLDYDNDTIIRRELLPSGKSRAFINDTPVTLKLINYLGNKFVNIHSQHQTLQLSDASFQLEVLDDFIVNPKLLSDYKEIYNKHYSILQRLKELIELNDQAVKDEDYLKFQFDELADASLDVDQIVEIESRVKFLEHAEEIKVALSKADTLLTKDEGSVLGNISALVKIISDISSYLPLAEELSQRLHSLQIELEDISSEIEIANTDDNFDPEELQIAVNKLNTIYSLYQKHHVVSVSELIVLRDDYDSKLQNISSLDNEIEVVKKELIILEKSLLEKSNRLHEERLNGSHGFSKAILKVLTQLGMKDAAFSVLVEQVDSFNNSGRDKVQFLFNANFGVEQGEISKVASGGELSRLMLAIKSLINKQQMLPTVIFDEIDSGVSGDIAAKVGHIMKKMAEKHQVIAISHLPQIASKANHHYKVYKLTSDNSTTTALSLLSEEGRVEELASMLSSKKITENALTVARELMSE